MNKRRVALIYYTANGQIIADKISQQAHYISYIYDKKQTTITDFLDNMFNMCDAIIFIASSGIAIRLIQPYIKSKLNDPAIICIDDNVNYVIPLLSGHIGNGNDIAKELASYLNSLPIITTASDTNNKFAVDEYAKQNHLHIYNPKQIKVITSAILNNKTVGFISDYQLPIPNQQLSETKQDNNIYITKNIPTQINTNDIYLIPKQYIVGMGVRKNKSYEEIQQFFLEELTKLQIKPNQVQALTTIDVKDYEQGLAILTHQNKIPYHSFAADELLAVEGEFESSEFVKSIVAVDNVCQRSIKAYNPNALLLTNKIKKNGMTIAIGYLPLLEKGSEH